MKVWNKNRNDKNSFAPQYPGDLAFTLNKSTKRNLGIDSSTHDLSLTLNEHTLKDFIVFSKSPC